MRLRIAGQITSYFEEVVITSRNQHHFGGGTIAANHCSDLSVTFIS